MTKFLLVAVLLLAACKEQRPPAPTPEQSQQLNEAENMLDNMAANEEGPERSPGPSNSTN
jgi:outer membrane lipoprotein-sorting protein